MMGERAHGGILEEVEQRDVVARLVTKLIMNLDHEKRMSAKIEEALIEPDRIDAEGVGPNGGDLALEFGRGLVAGGDRIFLVGFGQGAAIKLAVGGHGKFGEEKHGGGHNRLGKLGGEPLLEGGRGGRVAGLGDGVGDEALVLRIVLG